MSPAIVAAIVAAGALGAVLRYAVSRAVARRAARLPWAVLVVNVAGSALGGAALALATGSALDPGLQLVLVTGLAGGLTTFSTLSVETVQLVERGRLGAAAASLGANLACGVGACALAYLAVSAAL